jgi:molybdopterin/thiamine biosynthesis adenylyltransferase
MALSVREEQAPSIRQSVLAFQIDETAVQFVFTANGTVKTFSADDMVLRMIPLLDGSRTTGQIERAVSDSPAYRPEHFREVLDIMAAERLLLDPAADPTAGVGAGDLSAAELARYDRQLRLFADLCAAGSVGPGTTAFDLQLRLRRATVAIIGVGGLGGGICAALAAAGVGALRICDFDVVEPSNLNRQILFTSADVGRLKLGAAAERIAAINDTTRVEPIELRLTAGTDLGQVVTGADLVINCADQPSTVATSGWVFEACWPRGIPHLIGGSYAHHLGVLGTTMLPGRSACWDCARAETARDHQRDRTVPLLGSRGPGASLAMFTGTVANLLAWEALRVLTGLPVLLCGRWGELDLMSLQPRFRNIPRRPGCLNCTQNESEE